MFIIFLKESTGFLSSLSAPMALEIFSENSIIGSNLFTFSSSLNSPTETVTSMAGVSLNTLQILGTSSSAVTV